MFAIEFTRAADIRAGADREDCKWSRCMQRYVSMQEADDDCYWMSQEEPAFEFRVVPLFDPSEPPANDNGEL